MTWILVSNYLLLLGMWYPGDCLGVESDMESRNWEWGSGLQELLHSFPADSPFVTESPGRPANCTQRFWLPPSSAVCWDDIAGPEEFEQTRLLVLQNRAALHAVSQASGLEEGGSSYDQQAREGMEGVRAEHLSIAQTVDSIQKVFFSLEEKRKQGGELYTYSSLKEQIRNTMDSINGKEQMAALLEQHLSNLEMTLDSMQHRLTKLLAY
ncbi:uncharacterized protein si:ch211-57n23.1 isoform X1 [Electrophorus electricus]|uniref:uncharacterized protein si:ch211-57n23.1 isoform X1 n=1 Tax=Electrophorus electricus TaxID=8005 RepID=UPI0015CF8457|nr:uncharacterized protein si:ch211-57n23.1 isoform X1 [Electrophorus electricus]XP_026867857.2 uncharacterized protein si:ch211-57n23.1 isoform X1 [Electrophorus electricus]XP_026867858.2 uncharacterized protein si:ch211-57n23.1 isoform X1 [Electrophorus electricus]